MLTDLGIRTLPAPEKGVKRYWDKDGLCLQVSQGGTKTFYFVHGSDRQFLKLQKQTIAQIEKHSPADHAHALCLKIAGKESADVDGEQNCRKRKNAGEVSSTDVDINGAADDHGTEERGCRRDDDSDERDGHAAALA